LFVFCLLAPTTAPGLPRTFALIIDGLCGMIATRSAADRAAQPLLSLIWNRLRRLVARFASLAARVQAGPLPPPRRRTARKQSARQRQPELPKGYAWLIRLVQPTAQFAGQVQHLLSDPEMIALLEAAPQAGRIFRPLCRALAIPLPPALRPKPRPAKPDPNGGEPAKPPTKVKRKRRANRKSDPPSGAATGEVHVGRRRRGIRMPEPVRPPKPA
jgi:hypothetical protein